MNEIENKKIITKTYYEYVLEIFKLNKCNMIIKYCDVEYLVYNKIDLKRIFKNFLVNNYNLIKFLTLNIL